MIKISLDGRIVISKLDYVEIKTSHIADFSEYIVRNYREIVKNYSKFKESGAYFYHDGTMGEIAKGSLKQVNLKKKRFKRKIGSYHSHPFITRKYPRYLPSYTDWKYMTKAEAFMIIMISETEFFLYHTKNRDFLIHASWLHDTEPKHYFLAYTHGLNDTNPIRLVFDKNSWIKQKIEFFFDKWVKYKILDYTPSI